MSLDTVELIIEFEKAFDVNVPDLEWESASTLNDVVQLISRNKVLKTPKRDLFGEIFAKVCSTLRKTNLGEIELKPETQLKSIFPPDNLQAYWNEFEQSLGLKIPLLSDSDLGIQKPTKSFLEIFFSKSEPSLLMINEIDPHSSFTNDLGID